MSEGASAITGTYLSIEKLVIFLLIIIFAQYNAYLKDISFIGVLTFLKACAT